MNFKKIVNRLVAYNGPSTYRPFSLEETWEEQLLSLDGDIQGDTVSNKHHRRSFKKPSKLQKTKDTQEEKENWEVLTNLEENRKRVELLFHLPTNKDVVIRDFAIAGKPDLAAFIVFIDGLASSETINSFILQPLMLLSNLDPGQEIITCKKTLHKFLPSNQVNELKNYKEVIEEVTMGNTVIFIAGCNLALACETKGYPSRGIGVATTEQVVQGPQEGFVEVLRLNTGLIRRIIHSENLITEFLKVGTRNKANVAIMYLSDLANPHLVAEVKRRISLIKADYVPESGMLEGFIEDHPFSLIPQTIKTERPDRVAAHLAEGKIAIIVEGSPLVLILPVTFFSFLHSPEDHYVRFPHGFWLRILRVGAIFFTLLLPAFYIAVATFHQEMIPTDLLLSISAAKEMVPFPTVVEILSMELAFELIREAGVRVPGVIGPTLGIVGTLILGQAAVSAAIVSPISIIIVAVTGLSSFAIPNYAVAFGFRFMRFIFIFLAAALGFFGISVGLFVLTVLLVSMNSFGVPFFAPIAPRTADSADVVIRYPVWMQEQRPDHAQPLEIGRQPNISRTWEQEKYQKEQAGNEEGEQSD